jgi:hypothetical protein
VGDGRPAQLLPREGSRDEAGGAAHGGAHL